ncbi:MAG: UDP-2,3-diacylglucosamine diphosphatase [Giesbergeria sp.]|uniref:UDP-2,3-diacylglucosamine diphosphatase n=1 Tax=Giesbergeria sp. TaxID=2818473 RepID=UPI0026329DC0|nr:UDP-2,3-diacylglucosamine diphosphatase [Giesbergeria sp.]MDD2609671.1 UDP-2,3-diacylglucosamine diphosphatase [Giesbergeria sp.]
MLATVPRFEEFAAPSHWRTVDFISDLHLHLGDAATVATWQRYLHSTPADAVFMLGDLFEVWVGDDALAEVGSFEAECASVLHAVAQQRALFFLPGNRDFLFGQRAAQHCGLHLLSDPCVLQWRQQRYLLSHGDALCVDDVDYQRFRLVARSAAWRDAFLAQPLAQRRTHARQMRQASEARKQPATFYPDVDAPSAIAWLQAAGASSLIHGHTHRPAEHTLAPHLSRTVLSDWDLLAQPPRAEVLRLDGHGLQRIALA